MISSCMVLNTLFIYHRNIDGEYGFLGLYSDGKQNHANDKKSEFKQMAQSI